jgi:hypothetical protein
MRKISIRLVVALIMTVVLTGCAGKDDTVQSCIISNTSYTSQKELESASQPDHLIANENVYTSIHFIETPKGMEYTVKWYLDGTEIKTESKKTVNDLQDVVVYELDAKQALAGTLKLEVIYKDAVLLTKELKIQ